jgi:hypothetical protein
MKRAPNAFTPALVRWLSLDHVRLSAPPRTRERRVLDLLVRKKPDVDEKNVATGKSWVNSMKTIFKF